MQTAIEHSAGAPISAAKDNELLKIERAVWRSLDLPSGNPGACIRSAVERLAALKLIAERARQRALVAGSKSSITAVDMAERAVSRAERALGDAVAAKPEN